MTGDAAWLSGHAFLLLVDSDDVPAGIDRARSAGLRGVVLAPSCLQEAGDMVVAAVVGWPTGRHHTLVKAAEARLAVAQGATEIWLATDPHIADPNALLADIVAVREAVPQPVTLAVYCDPARSGAAARALTQAAALAGADRMVGASISGELPHTLLADSLATVIDALEAGADRVAVSDVAAVSPPPH
ncbi:hypothetical protein [Corynebacterium sp.]|uniref:hypothetical protein n=1 Tax=Corynebacterium sp. TaxID=1720 RepID=UPI0026E0F591|nr:hypothetical protein [Corynebacterium sp.]MDO5513062.1 hypothetical protein [Corynebacterium sp.]